MADGGSSRALQRSRRDRMFFGVCGGLGAYFGIDPVVVRLVFVLVSLAGGSGLLAYIILAIVIPEADPLSESAAELDPSERALRRGRNNQILGGVLLVVLGLLFLAGNLGWFRWFNWSTLWPVLLIVLGLAILFGRGRVER